MAGPLIVERGSMGLWGSAIEFCLGEGGGDNFSIDSVLVEISMFFECLRLACISKRPPVMG